MKRLITWVIIIVIILSMSIFGISCKTSTAEETVAEVAEETVAEVAGETVAEVAEETVAEEKPAEPYEFVWCMSDVNATWVTEMHVAIEALAKEKGMLYQMVDAKRNVETQITQMENFITKGVDVIIVSPAAQGGELDTVIQQAKDAGIKIVGHETELPLADTTYLLDNVEAGRKIGEYAGNYINENFGGACDFAHLGYPFVISVLRRSNAMNEALLLAAPNARLMATGVGASSAEAMTYVENFLQANPDIKVVTSVGDGGAIGANEAAAAAGLDPEEFAIFSCDGTQEAFRIIKEGGFIKMTLSFGSGQFIANDIVNEIVIPLMEGKEVANPFWRPTVCVDASNVDELLISE